MPTAPKPTELATALTALQTAIAGLEQPYEPKHEADAADLDEWKDHLTEVLHAAHAYAAKVVSALNIVTPAGIEDHTFSLAAAIESNDLDYVSDAIADVTGAIGKAADRVREAA